MRWHGNTLNEQLE